VRIQSVEFVGSAADLTSCPNRPLAEVALSGRSNVGKSSLLNALLGRRGIARVSATPGKTQLLNYFIVNGAFHVVDLPGYGYARMPATEHTRLRRMVHAYLRQRRQLRGVVQLLDARHEPSRDDIEMLEWLRTAGLVFCLVPTKMDKLRPGERKPALTRLLRGLDLPLEQPLVPFSSRTGEGRDALLDWVDVTVRDSTG